MTDAPPTPSAPFHRDVYDVPDLRRETDHLALHSVPSEDEDGERTGQVLLSTTLNPARLADVLEELADLVRTGQVSGS